MVASCNISLTPKDEGIKNAEQFVKEQYNLNMENIESIVGEEQDSLLGLTHLSFANLEMAKASNAYWKGAMSKKDFKHVSDSLYNLLVDANYDWRFNGAGMDSIKSQYKYRNCKRRVIKVVITYKSGTSDTKRILMENDGITPNITEDAYGQQLLDWQRDFLQMSKTY